MKQVSNFQAVLAGALMLILAGCTAPGDNSPNGQAGPGGTGDFPGGEIVDLSYAYNDSTVFWPTAGEFELTVDSEGMTEAGHFYSANSFSMAEHGGTHLDAPYHFYEEGITMDQIPPEQLMGEGIVVDVSDSALANPDYRVQISDFQAWEQENGQIPAGAIVIVRTGYGQFWPDRERYMGTAERGPDAVADLHFPGLHPEAAEWLTSERDIKMLGLDTPSLDYGQSTDFRSHVILASHDIAGLENLANLERLPSQGFRVIALPMKIEGGSGGPVRVLAILHDTE
ncbi:MAG: cyclase family protein [Balneolaceae bacterium]|nr:cyclase family protein [Balneolaceae bacterium]